VLVGAGAMNGATTITFTVSGTLIDASAPIISGPFYVAASQSFTAGSVRGQSHVAGSVSGQSFVAGSVKGQSR
jgi:hypothetical protein